MCRDFKVVRSSLEFPATHTHTHTPHLGNLRSGSGQQCLWEPIGPLRSGELLTIDLSNNSHRTELEKCQRVRDRHLLDDWVYNSLAV